MWGGGVKGWHGGPMGKTLHLTKKDPGFWSFLGLGISKCPAFGEYTMFVCVGVRA